MENDGANLRYNKEIKKEFAMGKKNYWISCGNVLFNGDEALKHKWEEFVTENIDGVYAGAGIDEMIQIISMIQMQIPSEEILQVIEQLPDKNFVLYNLGMFVHPELIPKEDSRKI